MLIPAYKPDERFVEITAALIGSGIDVLAVDDGSGPQYTQFFEKAATLGAAVLRHDINRGKGAALRTGISALMSREDVLGIVTADADGQHTLEDIGKIISEMQEHPGVFVIGARQFKGEVPLRSRFGNSVDAYGFPVCHRPQSDGYADRPSGAAQEFV